MMYEQEGRGSQREPASAGGAPGVAKPIRAGYPVDVGRILVVLRRARWVLVATVLVGGVAGVFLSKKLVTPQFLAQGALVWEPPRTTETVVGKPDLQPPELKTLIDTVKIPENLAHLREQLSLPISLGPLGTSISADAADGSRLVVISAVWGDRDVAANIVNTLVERVVAERKIATEERARNERDFLRARVARARTTLQGLRARYNEFRAQYEIIDLESQRTATQRELYDLEHNAERALAEYESERARGDVLQSAVTSMPDSIPITSVDPYASRLIEVKTKLVQARSEYTEEHPWVRALASEEALLHKSLEKSKPIGKPTLEPNRSREQLERELVGTRANESAARQRRAVLDRIATATKRRALTLSEVSGKGEELLAAIAGAETRLSSLESTLLQAEEVEWAPDVRVVSRAEPPRVPMKSRRKIVAVATPVVLLVLVLIGVLVRGVIGLKAHTPSEVAFWGASAVVASSSWPRESSDSGELCADLLDQMRKSSGDLLVVPFTEDDRKSARELLESFGRSVGAISAVYTADSIDTRLEESAPERGSPPSGAVLQLWEGEPGGPSLRRACRRASRVLVVAETRKLSILNLLGVHNRLGSETLLGFVLLGVEPDLSHLPDRAGNVDAFWSTASGDSVGA